MLKNYFIKKINKKLAYPLIITFFLYCQVAIAQIIDPNLAILQPISNPRNQKPLPPISSLEAFLAKKTLNCSGWQYCKNTSQLQTTSIVEFGVDFFTSGFWSVPIRLSNGKSTNHKHPQLTNTSVLLELFDVSIGIGRNQIKRLKKYSTLNFFFSLGIVSSSAYYYAGGFNAGFSLSQNPVCKASPLCQKGTGLGINLDLGTRVSIKEKFNLGFRINQSAVNYTLKDTKDTNLTDIKANFGGLTYGVFAGLNW